MPDTVVLASLATGYGPRRVLRTLLLCEAVIVGLFILGIILKEHLGTHGTRGLLLDLTHVNSERGFATWFSVLQLFSAAVILAAIAVAQRRDGSRWWRHWAGLAFIVLALSLDEQVGIHEIIAGPVRRLLKITEGPLLLAWVVPALVLVALVVLLYTRFAIALPRRISSLFAVAVLIFLGGSVGMEMVDAVSQNGDFSYLGQLQAIRGPVYQGLEETLEMVAVSVLIYALLRFAGRAEESDADQSVGDVEKQVAG